eukprot:scaffold13592_cov47-Attheya_sp.AAC.1
MTPRLTRRKEYRNVEAGALLSPTTVDDERFFKNLSTLRVSLGLRPKTRSSAEAKRLREQLQQSLVLHEKVLSGLRQELRDMQLTVEEKEASFQKQNEDLLQAIQNEASKSQDEVQQANLEAEDARSEYAAMEARCQDAEKQAEALSAAMTSKFDTERSELLARIESTRVQVEQLRAEKEGMLSDKQNTLDAEKQAEALSAEMTSKFDTERSELLVRIESTSVQVEQLQAEKEEMLSDKQNTPDSDETIVQLKAELQEYKSQSATTKRELQIAREQADNAILQASMVQEKLQEEVDDAKSELQIVTIEAQQGKSNDENIKLELEDKKSQLQSLRHAMEQHAITEMQIVVELKQDLVRANTALEESNQLQAEIKAKHESGELLLTAQKVELADALEKVRLKDQETDEMRTTQVRLQKTFEEQLEKVAREHEQHIDEIKQKYTDVQSDVERTLTGSKKAIEVTKSKLAEIENELSHARSDAEQAKEALSKLEEETHAYREETKELVQGKVEKAIQSAQEAHAKEIAELRSDLATQGQEEIVKQQAELAKSLVEVRWKEQELDASMRTQNELMESARKHNDVVADINRKHAEAMTKKEEALVHSNKVAQETETKLAQVEEEFKIATDKATIIKGLISKIEDETREYRENIDEMIQCKVDEAVKNEKEAHTRQVTALQATLATDLVSNKAAEETESRLFQVEEELSIAKAGTEAAKETISIMENETREYRENTEEMIKAKIHEAIENTKVAHAKQLAELEEASAMDLVSNKAMEETEARLFEIEEELATARNEAEAGREAISKLEEEAHVYNERTENTIEMKIQEAVEKEREAHEMITSSKEITHDARLAETEEQLRIARNEAIEEKERILKLEEEAQIYREKTEEMLKTKIQEAIENAKEAHAKQVAELRNNPLVDAYRKRIDDLEVLLNTQALEADAEKQKSTEEFELLRDEMECAEGELVKNRKQAEELYQRMKTIQAQSSVDIDKLKMTIDDTVEERERLKSQAEARYKSLEEEFARERGDLYALKEQSERHSELDDSTVEEYSSDENLLSGDDDESTGDDLENSNEEPEIVNIDDDDDDDDDYVGDDDAGDEDAEDEEMQTESTSPADLNNVQDEQDEVGGEESQVEQERMTDKDVEDNTTNIGAHTNESPSTKKRSYSNLQEEIVPPEVDAYDGVDSDSSVEIIEDPSMMTSEAATSPYTEVKASSPRDSAEGESDMKARILAKKKAKLQEQEEQVQS